MTDVPVTITVNGTERTATVPPRLTLADFLRTYGIMLNDLKVLILPKDERMRELISLQAMGLTPIEAVRYYLALRMAEKGLVSAPNAAAGLPYNIGGPTTALYPVGADGGDNGSQRICVGGAGTSSNGALFSRRASTGRNTSCATEGRNR